MRLEFMPSPERRAALRAQRARLEQSTEVLTVLRPEFATDVAAADAACSVQSLHRLPLAPESPTTPEQLIAQVAARCERLRRRWPDAAPVMEPMVSALADAVSSLDPAEPAPVHGDLWAGQFLWTGERLVLLDL